MMATISLPFRISAATRSPGILPASTGTSIHRSDSSHSSSMVLISQMKSARDFARRDKRSLAPTEVPARRSWPPKIRDVRSSGRDSTSRTTRNTYCWVRLLQSSQFTIREICTRTGR